MAEKKLYLRRKIPPLPLTLTDRESSIGKTLRVATVHIEEDMPEEALTINLQQMAKTACSHYKPDKIQGLLCDSGSNGRTPYRGRTCCLGNCQLSQVTAKSGWSKTSIDFVYLGEEEEISSPQTPEDVLVTKIFSKTSVR